MIVILSTFFLLSQAIVAQQQCAKMTVRKEMNGAVLSFLTSLDLTDQDWEVYLTTLKQAATIRDPTNGLTIWETAVKHHVDWAPPNHGSATFLYYHRYFLVWMEQKLQQINPNFAFFYWDSSREFSFWRQSKIWSKLGGDRGTPVTDGPFAGINFGYVRGPLVRDFNSTDNPPSVEYFGQLYQNSLNKTNGYADYAVGLEWGHGMIHKLVGGLRGQMIQMTSPIDPIFYAHHAFVDYTFFQAQMGWKAAGYDASYSIGGLLKNRQPLTADTPIQGFEQWTPKRLLDVGDLCIRYARIGENLGSNGGSAPVASVTTSGTVSATVPATVPVATSSSTAPAHVHGGRHRHHKVPANYFPSQYDPKAQFSLDLPKSWIDMSFGNSYQTAQQSAYSIQTQIVNQLSAGQSIPPPPLILDSQNRPYLGRWETSTTVTKNGQTTTTVTKSEFKPDTPGGVSASYVHTSWSTVSQFVNGQLVAFKDNSTINPVSSSGTSISFGWISPVFGLIISLSFL